MTALLQHAKNIIDVTNYKSVIIIAVNGDGSYDSADWSETPEQEEWAHDARNKAEQGIAGFPDRKMFDWLNETAASISCCDGHEADENVDPLFHRLNSGCWELNYYDDDGNACVQEFDTLKEAVAFRMGI